jgi:hypothetical protein
MSDLSREDTLLALLLALKDLEDPLSETERAQLYEVGEQLELDPDDWEFIYEGLRSIVTANKSLNQLLQSAQTKLASLDSHTKLQLMPTDRELAELLPGRDDIEWRGDSNSTQLDVAINEIIKITIICLKDKDPSEAVKQSRWINRTIDVAIEKR